MDYIEHLKQSDEVMLKLIIKYGELKIEEEYIDVKDIYFENLVTTIIGQQLSLKVAEVIKQRISVYLDNQITPIRVIEADNDELRKRGLSQAKINYIKNLARSVFYGDIDLSKINKLTDCEVVNELTKIKGIGQWTAEMFLIFSLKRLDVFSLSDAGLLNAIKKLYGESLDKQEILAITNKWKPYRSYAALYLWKSLEK